MGSSRNLFALGSAELVTDPALTKEPLANPGKVVKRSRSSAAEQCDALGDNADAPARASQPAKADKPAKPVRPMPSRAELDAAEKALADAEGRQRQERDALAGKEAKLREKRRRLEKTQREELAKLQPKRDRADDAHDEAMRHWRG